MRKKKKKKPTLKMALRKHKNSKIVEDNDIVHKNSIKHTKLRNTENIKITIKIALKISKTPKIAEGEI